MIASLFTSDPQWEPEDVTLPKLIPLDKGHIDELFTNDKPRQTNGYDDADLRGTAPFSTWEDPCDFDDFWVDMTERFNDTEAQHETEEST